MKIKHTPQDFRVRELLADGYVGDRGRHRVYRVTKKKLTSFEAARALADMAGVPPAEVGLAGLKDRQGVTTQYMSVEGGRPVRWSAPDLKIEPVGFAHEGLSSSHSVGNHFEVTLRHVTPSLRQRIETGLAEVREHGFVNYFGEQRFGNLRFGQGWVARRLALGEREQALKELLCGRSDVDDARHREFKQMLAARWGNWRACRDIAGKYGAHHSVFEELGKDPEDFAAALRRVAARLRLIHLYAWQSHVWNRAVSAYVASITPARERLFVEGIEGPLAFARGALAADPAMENGFRLPGEGLEDVAHPVQREFLAAELARQGLEPEQFRIEGVSGFQLKGEDRDLIVRPRRLKLFDYRDDAGRITLRFELPRGAYATLLVARLTGFFAVEPTRTGPLTAAGERDDRAPRAERGERAERAPRPKRDTRETRDARGKRPPRAGRDERGPRRPPAASRPRAPQPRSPATKQRGNKPKKGARR